jgi:iron complex transport system ATP-binding protein
MRRLTQLGCGLIIATHDFAEIVPEIERAILIRDGRIYGDGPISEMLTPQRLAELFELPVERCGTCGAIDFAHVT